METAPCVAMPVKTFRKWRSTLDEEGKEELAAEFKKKKRKKEKTESSVRLQFEMNGGHE